MIQNGNPNWDNNVTYIRINKEILVPMKQINKQLKKELEEKKESKKQQTEQLRKDKKDKYYLSRFESNDY